MQNEAKKPLLCKVGFHITAPGTYTFDESANVTIGVLHCGRCETFLSKHMKFNHKGYWEYYDPVEIERYRKKVLVARELGSSLGELISLGLTKLFSKPKQQNKNAVSPPPAALVEGDVK